MDKGNAQQLSRLPQSHCPALQKKHIASVPSPSAYCVSAALRLLQALAVSINLTELQAMSVHQSPVHTPAMLPPPWTTASVLVKSSSKCQLSPK